MTYPPPPGQPPYPPSPGEPLPPPVDPYDSPQYTQPLYGPPESGLPTYGPPESGPPAYGPPTYAQTSYGQPGYGQPAYGQPGFPTAPQSPPAASRTVAITLLSAAIALVILVGGGITFYLVGANSSQKENDRVAQGESPSPSASPSPSPSATTKAARDVIRISEPDTLNGQPKIKAEELSSLTTDLAKELEGYPGAANAFGAVYGSLPDKKLVAALAAEVDIDDPQRMLDTVFQSFSGQNQLTSVTPASTVPLGGVAQCGNTVIGTEDVALCGWADEGSVGMFLFFYETAVDVKGDFPDMRAEIEKKN